MANLESRIVRLETKHSDPLIDSLHTLACTLAQEQGCLEPELPGDLALALKQLSEYLPD